MTLTPTMEYKEIEPHVEWVDSETVHMLVSGFKREELRVQVTSTGKLKISGERRVDGRKVSWFEKELHIPDDCDVSGITAKYESEILQIKLPRNATTPVTDPKHSHVPLSQPPPQLPDKHSHEHLPKPQLLDVGSSHEQHFQEPHTKLPDAKSSHEPFQVHRPQLHDDKSSHQQHFQLPGTHLPDNHRPDATTAKPSLAKPVHDAEANGSARDRKFGEVEARRPGMELENSKSKLSVVLVVVGALVVGYLYGRLDQAVRDGWTIVQRFP